MEVPVLLLRFWMAHGKGQCQVCSALVLGCVTVACKLPSLWICPDSKWKSLRQPCELLGRNQSKLVKCKCLWVCLPVGNGICWGGKAGPV